MVGTIQLPDNFLNPGTITGGGTVKTNTLTNSGHIAPGNGVGALTLAGNFVQAGAGVLDIQLGALGAHDLLTVTGTASLNGGLALSCFGDCFYAVGSEITILDSVGDLSGTFAGALTLSGFATGAFNVVYDYDHDLVKLVAIEEVTPVPEPETWAMLLAGLGVVGFAARRRRMQEG